MWRATKPRLDAFRQAMLDDERRVRQRPRGPGVHRRVRAGGESRDGHAVAPPGYPPDHPRADLFRYKDIVFGRRLSDDEVYSPDLPRILADAYAKATPCSASSIYWTTEAGVRQRGCYWIQRTGWPDLRDARLAAERAGWDSIWLDDHLLSDEGAGGPQARRAGRHWPLRLADVPRQAGAAGVVHDVPEPGPRSPSSRRRSITSRAVARSSVSAGAGSTASMRLSASTSTGVRRAAGPPSRGRDADPPPARRGAGHPPGTILRACMTRSPFRRPGDPGRRIPDRGLREAEDAAHDGHVRRPGGTGTATPLASPRSPTCCGPAARRSAAVSRTSIGWSPSTPSSAIASGGRRGVERDRRAGHGSPVGSALDGTDRA